jgi:Raf kinase inhibitor-like YbhB/YbcL family protein
MVLRKFWLTTALLAASVAGAWAFELKSPAFSEGGAIGEKHVFNGFGCAGGNLSPVLHWSDPPAGTKSFALLVHDPDAPTGGAGFWHWAVIDIPASTRSLPEGVGRDGKGLPEGAVEIATDFGVPGYGGPCPPKGDRPHRYNFTIYALKVEKLELPPHATASLAGFLIHANALDKAKLTGVYDR